MSKHKEYIGDSVYADFDGMRIVVTTENGYPDDPRNQIYFDPEVFFALVRYGKRFWIPQKTEDGAEE